jgi:pimeloyl-ACP methyl ester carboxylesterase
LNSWLDERRDRRWGKENKGPGLADGQRFLMLAPGHRRACAGSAFAGGLRWAAFGFGFLQLLGRRCTVLAPDYPVLRSFEQFDQGLSAILWTERIGPFHLAGQSYGGVLAQPFLACHPQPVGRLVHLERRCPAAKTGRATGFGGLLRSAAKGGRPRYLGLWTADSLA